MKKTSKRTSSFLSSVMTGLNTEGQQESDNLEETAEQSKKMTTEEGNATKFEKRLFHAEDAYVRTEPRFENTDLVRLDPKECRIWTFHNRRYDLLDENNCGDLIEGFQESGRQELAGIVRRVNDDSVYQYEVIAGARRHWTCTHLGWKYLAEIRDLTDEEAFILADVENRSRKDISDYERAIDYRRALTEIVSEKGQREGRSKSAMTQAEFAKRLGKSEGWLSQFLYLASLPVEIVAAFPKITDIGLSHGRELKPLLDKQSTREKLLKEAQSLVQDESRTVVSVMKRLLAAGQDRKKVVQTTNVLGVFEGKDGKKAITVKRKGKRDLSIELNRLGLKSKEEALELIKKAIDTFY
jgi:ParB family chromosome partitioning protein